MPRSKTSSVKAKELRARSRAAGQIRKEQRRMENAARHEANVAAGKAPKRRKRKADNMKYCDRCTVGGPRLIVCGQVCICVSIGAGNVGGR